MKAGQQLIQTCRGVADGVGTPRFIVDAVIQHLDPSIRLLPHGLMGKQSLRIKSGNLGFDWTAELPDWPPKENLGALPNTM